METTPKWGTFREEQTLYFSRGNFLFQSKLYDQPNMWNWQYLWIAFIQCNNEEDAVFFPGFFQKMQVEMFFRRLSSIRWSAISQRSASMDLPSYRGVIC